MTVKVYGRCLPVRAPIDQAPHLTCLDPSSAQFGLWLARAQRDCGMISDKEMAVVERVNGALARKSITLFNPFTMERRKVELP